VPLYTPLRTDEKSVSLERVFLGAINTYLQVKSPLFARIPKFARGWLDRPSLLRWIGRFSSSTSARDLGELALAVLAGEDGATRQQLDQLIAWLKEDLKPEIVHLQSSMFAGLAHTLRRELGVPVICSLQGEDLFLESLVEPYRSRAFEILRRRQGDIDGFVTGSDYFAGHMATSLGIDRERIHLVPLGLRLEDFSERPARDPATGPFVVGYLARICPEKGFGIAVAGFRRLASVLGQENVRLRIAGYLGAGDRPFFEKIMAQVRSWGLASSVEVVGEVDRPGKVAFLHSLDVLSVPTIYREPKGLFALEAMACGVPVVLPRHGAFPEMVEACGGGLLVEPESPDAVAEGLLTLHRDPARRLRMGQDARRSMLESHSIEATAQRMLGVYEEVLKEWGAHDGEAGDPAHQAWGKGRPAADSRDQPEAELEAEG